MSTLAIVKRGLLWAICILFFLSILLVLPLRWFAPISSAFMLQAQWSGQTEVHYRWQPLPKISPSLAIAVVAAEDQKFPNHFGFDFKSIFNAFNERGARRRGASTISQQLAKNLYLWGGRSYLRKGIEAYFTVLIEVFWPKDRILEVYLNIAEFGPGVYGAAAASNIFFNKPPDRLTPYESALLAAVLPNPKRMSAHTPSEYVHQRAQEIIRIAESLGGEGYL